MNLPPSTRQETTCNKRKVHLDLTLCRLFLFSKHRTEKNATVILALQYKEKNQSFLTLIITRNHALFFSPHFLPWIWDKKLSSFDNPRLKTEQATQYLILSIPQLQGHNIEENTLKKTWNTMQHSPSTNLQLSLQDTQDMPPCKGSPGQTSWTHICWVTLVRGEPLQ